MANLDEVPRGELAIQTLAMPADTNANGDIFGGWLVSHMDLGASIVSKRRTCCRVVTVAIDKLVFKKPVYVGDIVSCYGEIIKIGRTSLTVNMEVWTLSVSEKQHKKVACAIFTFVAIDDQGKPKVIERHE